MKLTLIIFYVCIALISNAQGKIDSVKRHINTIKNNVAKANDYYQLSLFYSSLSQLDSAKKYGELALKISTEEGYKNLIYLSAFELCKIYIYKGDYNQAIDVGETSILYATESSKPSLYNRLGAAYYYNEDYSNAFNTYSKALKYNGDSESKVLAYNGLGNQFYAQGRWQEALGYYQKAYGISKNTYLNGTKKRDLDLQANCLLNLANTQDNLNNWNDAVTLFKKAIAIYDIKKDDVSKAQCLMNLGIVYMNQKKYEDALDNFNQSLLVFQKYNDKENTILCLINLGCSYSRIGNEYDAESFLQKSILLAKDLESLDYLKNCYEYIIPVYAQMGNYKKAYEYSDLYNKVEDSLNTKLFNERIAKQQTIHITKEIQDANTVLETQNKQQQQQHYFLLAIIGIVGLVSFFIFRQYRRNKKLNIELTNKNEAINFQKKEIDMQNEILAHQNLEITDSINYAKRIQESFLTSDTIIKQVLPQHFILYKPRNIVSGDFYWVFDLPDRTLVACADCTGHGIPGAFMSLIGISLLNEITHSKNITEPASILDELRRIIICALNPQQLETGGKDGMDMTLVSIFKCTNNNNVRIQFAGANNALYIKSFTGNELTEYKADNQPVGYYSHAKPFTQQEIIAQKGDTLYLFTDGYPDQFGGTKGKKFMSKQLKQQLANNSDLSLHEQSEKLNNALVAWQGNLEQVDDVLVMGIKL